jgi:CheY-like chemotaxis protein
MNGQTERANHRILIVDDNRAIHEDFKKIFCRVDESTDLHDLEAAVFGKSEPTEKSSFVYDLDHALQGKEAFYKVQAAVREGHPYTLAFVDMRMPPGWNGLKTIENLWNVDPDIHAVICTAYSDYSWQEMVNRLTKQEQWLILKKPFDNSEVCQLAASLTRKWTQHKAFRDRITNLERLLERREHAALR